VLPVQRYTLCAALTPAQLYRFPISQFQERPVGFIISTPTGKRTKLNNVTALFTKLGPCPPQPVSVGGCERRAITYKTDQRPPGPMGGWLPRPTTGLRREKHKIMGVPYPDQGPLNNCSLSALRVSSVAAGEIFFCLFCSMLPAFSTASSSPSLPSCTRDTPPQAGS